MAFDLVGFNTGLRAAQLRLDVILQQSFNTVMFKNIVVTGGAGFIGSNLTLELQERYPDAEITVVDDFRSGDFKNLEGFRGDIVVTDLSTIDLSYYFDPDQIDVVFHLASITDTTDHDQKRQTHDNVESWRNLLDHFVDGEARLIFASSAATYGISDGINRVGQPLKPANVYAFSKVQLENLAQKFMRENPQRWVVGLRYFNVYGPRETHKGVPASMIYHLAQQMRAGQSPRLFKYGEQCRDFVYVKDIVAYTIAAATTEMARVKGRAGIYNAGSGQARSFNDIVENLNRVLQTDLQTTYIDNPYAFYQPHTEADLEATKAALAMEPQFSLEEGIDDYAASGWLFGDAKKG